MGIWKRVGDAIDSMIKNAQDSGSTPDLQQAEQQGHLAEVAEPALAQAASAPSSG